MMANKWDEFDTIFVGLGSLLMVVLLLVGASFLPVGGDQNHPAAPPAPPAPPAPYVAPSIDILTQVPSQPDLDPATLNPVNNGFDMVLDEVRGNMRMDLGNRLYWTVPGKPPVVVLEIKGDLVAYRMDMLPGDSEPRLIYYTKNRKGYSCACFGLSVQGVPYFGEPKAESDWTPSP